MISKHFILLVLVLTINSCTEPKATGKSIISIDIKRNTEGIIGNFALEPEISFSEDSSIINAKIGPGYKINQLDYALLVSDKAEIILKPEDLRIPQYIIIQSEAGEIKKYLLIVTQVSGTITDIKEWDAKTNYITTKLLPLENNYTCAYAKYDSLIAGLSASDKQIEMGIIIDLFSCKGRKARDHYYVRLFLDRKDFAINMVNNYEIQPKSTTTVALERSVYFSAEDKWVKAVLFKPSTGNIIITFYNDKLNLISGKYNNIIYDTDFEIESGSTKRETLIMNGYFYNVPCAIK